MKAIRSLLRHDRGAAIIEAAIVLPILLVLTFGIWQTARAWNIQSSLDHAAREAARYGATVEPWVGETSPDLVRAVIDADLSASAIDTDLVNTVCIELIADAGSSCDLSHANGTGTEQIFVKLRYPDYTMDFVFFSATLDMDATAVARFEAGP